MKKLFLKTPVELPIPPSPKVKYQSLLHNIGGGWYVNNLVQNLSPIKRILIKKAQEKEDEIKIKLHDDNQDWNGCKF